MDDHILVGTTVWIDFFRRRTSWRTERLKYLLRKDFAATGDYVIHEVLRGVRSPSELLEVRDTLAVLPSCVMLGDLRAVRSAMRYRELRQKGITVRKPNDAIIASYCIDEGMPLLTADRDFLPYAQHMGLKIAAE